MEIKRIMVCGAGFMGAGIAQVFAQSGLMVSLQDLTPEITAKAMAGIEKNLAGQVAKNRIEEAHKASTMSRITPVSDHAAAKNCDLVIEAIVENKQAKGALFRQLDEICPPGVIFASNTSSFPITELAAATKRPEKFIGMHFFSPVPVMKLVEIIKGLKTAEATGRIVMELTERIGKVGIFVKDGPGFLVNRVHAAFRNEVLNCLAEGVATIEDIDKAIKFGLNHPMGPFELNDFSGLDVGYAVAETLWENLKDPKWRPSPLARKLIMAGDLGRKTGKGWYDYSTGEKKTRTDINL